MHRRTFSFTDASASVKLEPLSSESAFSLASSPAKQLLLLRQLQSTAYQKLYLSNRLAPENPWHVISTSFDKMRVWAQNLPATMSKSLKFLLLSELQYGHILLFCAPGVWRDNRSYASAMVGEYATQYSNQMSSLLKMTEQPALYTSHDVLRASYVGDRLLDILTIDGSLASNGTSPAPPLLPSNFPPLPNSYRSRSELINQARGCIASLDSILEHLCLQYQYPEPLSEYRERSTMVLRNLGSDLTT